MTARLPRARAAQAVERPAGAARALPQHEVLGIRLRTARQANGSTIRELARRLGCSPSLISQIERGKVAPSVSRLYTLAAALGISMDSLFDWPGHEAGRRPVPARVVQRRADRPSINLEHDVRWERLTAQHDELVDFCEVIYGVGGGSRATHDAIRHAGREYAVVIQGKLEAQIGFGRWTLNVGDSISFDSTTPHLYWNEGAEPARVIWCVLRG